MRAAISSSPGAISSLAPGSCLSPAAQVGLRGADADGRIRQLVAARGLLRPRLAALALVLVRKRRHERLGFRSLGDYGRERLGVGARVLREWARVWQTLSTLPRLRTALLCGDLPWTVARRVVALATPETEEACLECVRGRTVRAVEAMLRAVASASAESPGLRSDSDADDPDARVRVVVSVEPAVLPRWDAALELARRMAGESLPVWECAEAIAAETLTVLELPAAGDTAAVDEPQPHGRPLSRGHLSEADRHESGLRHEAFPTLRWRGPSVLPAAGELEALEAWAADACAHDLDTALREAVRALQQFDHDLGLLLREVLDRRLFTELGFTRFDRYVEERVDVSPRTARRWVRLARLGGTTGGAVATAFRTGEVTALQAALLAQACALRPGGASPAGLTAAEAAHAWLALARQVTLRRLESEVAGACAASPGAVASISFYAPPEVASVFLSALEAARRHLADTQGELAPPARALSWMLEHAIASWLEQGEAFEDYADFERDGFRCTAPGCSARRSLHSHHIVFRSAGGPDEAWNRTTLCAFHHQRGVHAGLVHCHGRAPDRLVFALGTRRGGPALLRARSGDVLEPECSDGSSVRSSRRARPSPDGPLGLPQHALTYPCGRHPQEAPMIGYTTFGTNDLARAARFYDGLLAELGAQRAMEMETFIAWGTAPGAPMVAVIKPFDGKPATVGNGVMVALAAKSKEQVDAIHKKALALGGRDEGAPGPRGDGFYAGYFRDLDGNKLNAFFIG